MGSEWDRGAGVPATATCTLAGLAYCNRLLLIVHTCTYLLVLVGTYMYMHCTPSFRVSFHIIIYLVIYEYLCPCYSAPPVLYQYT
jgi:hypothetical protein